MNTFDQQSGEETNKDRGKRKAEDNTDLKDTKKKGKKAKSYFLLRICTLPDQTVNGESFFNYPMWPPNKRKVVTGEEIYGISATDGNEPLEWMQFMKELHRNIFMCDGQSIPLVDVPAFGALNSRMKFLDSDLQFDILFNSAKDRAVSLAYLSGRSAGSTGFSYSCNEIIGEHVAGHG
jgi:hypothetical protein